MPVIKELSPHLADLIAAGEVVERPASAAKEMIENAIDAGATRIAVEIQNGGITFLRITDNGCGMEPEDVPVAFRRHATSKLRTETDLSAIGTLGFRGEALAAIASVARIDLLTKRKDALAGTHLHLEAGTITELEDVGCPEGTTIVVRDLFFNTPARMKFLKKDYTEAGYVLSVVQHAALSRPDISFTMIKDGKPIFSSAGDGKLMTPVFGVLGRDVTDNMIAIAPFERDNIHVHGYITKPHFARPNRTLQHFYVNGRYVKNRTLQAALEEAYRNQIITGKYPSCVLFVSLPLGAVDVNVHPAKTEVKFAQEKQIFECVYIACKNSLENNNNIPVFAKKSTAVKEDNITANQQEISTQTEHVAPKTSPSMAPSAQAVSTPVHSMGHQAKIQIKPRSTPAIECDDFDDEANATANKLQQSPLQILTAHRNSATTPAPFQQSLRAVGLPLHQKTSVQDATGKTPKEVSAHGPYDNVSIPQNNDCSEAFLSENLSTPSYSMASGKARVIGEAFHTYIVAEDAQGLLLIDKHAAHERMIFNQLKQSTTIPQQQILTPIIVETTPTESATLTENMEQVRATGFDIESFGNNSFAVRGAPAYLDCADVPAVLSEIAEKLACGKSAVSDKLDDLIHMVACKAAIKAGKQTHAAELQSVCDRVLSDAEIAACPHGRPVTVRLTRYELDKLFKRVNQ